MFQLARKRVLSWVEGRAFLSAKLAQSIYTFYCLLFTVYYLSYVHFVTVYFDDPLKIRKSRHTGQMTQHPWCDDVEYNELPHALQSSACFSLSPTMELLSFQLSDTVVWLYRRGNERVWDIESSDPENKIANLEWKPDGKQFAILFTNGSIELYDSMNGSLIRTLNLGSNILTQKWFKGTPSLTSHRKNVAGILDEMNIIKSLPLLNSNNDIDSNNNMEMIENEDSLDVLLACSSNGSFNCIFAGIFIIDNIALEELSGCEILNIMSDETMSHQYLLAQESNNNNNSNELHLCKFNTQFLSNNKQFKNILITCSKLSNLINYFKTSINKINSHYKPYIDYTIRIIELLRGEIKDIEENNENANNENNDINNDSNNTDPIYDLYDLLLTGSLSNATKKWLTDYLSDRGVKRWTKLGRAYFDNARSSIFDDLISSLHHLIIYLTDLKGVNQWNPNSISIYQDDINECIKISENYLKYSYKFMMQLNDNQRYFEQTIIWISSILAEITADEKINITFKTNDITKYLMFISTKLNSIDNSENTGNVSTNDDSKISDFAKVLETVLNKLFDKIKNDIRLNFKIGCNVVIASDVSLFKFINTIADNKSGYIYAFNQSLSKINVKKYDLATLDFIESNVPLIGAEEVLDMKPISTNKILILYPNKVIIYKIIFSADILQKLAVYDLNSYFNEKRDFKFQAGYLAVNQAQNLFCVLDKTKKNYFWINYERQLFSNSVI